MAIQFLYNNFLDTSATLITSTSQETNFPDDNIILTDRNKPWRTPTAAGYFNISAGTRNIDFRDAAGALAVAQMSISAYSIGSLRAEIQGQMDTTASLDTFLVTFTSSFTWEIQRSGGGSLTLLWFDGVNGNSIGRTLGYSTSSNQSTTTGTLTAQDRAIHTYEFIHFDLGSARTISALGIIDRLIDGIQVQTSVNSGTVRWQGSDTNIFTSLTFDGTLAIQSGQYILRPTGGTGTIPSARYWRAFISDPRNSNGYVQLGYISIGQPFEPTSSDVSPDFAITVNDESPEERSIGGQRYYDARDKYKSFNISLPLISNPDHDTLFDIFSITGISHPFFLLIDPTLSISLNLGELSVYGRFGGNLEFSYRISDLYDLSFNLIEAL